MITITTAVPVWAGVGFPIARFVTASLGQRVRGARYARPLAKTAWLHTTPLPQDNNLNVSIHSIRSQTLHEITVYIEQNKILYIHTKNFEIELVNGLKCFVTACELRLGWNLSLLLESTVIIAPEISNCSSFNKSYFSFIAYIHPLLLLFFVNEQFICEGNINNIKNK